MESTALGLAGNRLQGLLPFSELLQLFFHYFVGIFASTFLVPVCSPPAAGLRVEQPGQTSSGGALARSVSCSICHPCCGDFWGHHQLAVLRAGLGIKEPLGGPRAGWTQEGIWVIVSQVSLGKESWEKVLDVGVCVCTIL